MPDIAACPFCGSRDDPATQQLGPSIFTEGSRHFVGCVQCGARGPMISASQEPSDAHVIGRWNARECAALRESETELRNLKEARTILLPISRDHADKMVLVGEAFLKLESTR